METLADLRRTLKIGAQVTLTSAPEMPSHKYLNVTRFVIKTQTNGVLLSLDKDSKKGSFLDIPKASLVDFDGSTFTIYNPAMRDLTDKEQSILDNKPSNREENKKKVEIDMLSDGSSMFYADRKYFKEIGAEHLDLCAHDFTNGLRFDHNDHKIIDQSVKGSIQLVYTIAA